MTATDAQVRKLMSHYTKTGHLEKSAAKADLSPKTARKYIKEGKLPSQMKKPRDYRTRPDPFERDWDELAAMLRDAPELEAKTLFEFICQKHPDRYKPGQLRTLQRRVRTFRALYIDSDKEVMFEQIHAPAEALQTDWTWADALNITIAGEPFRHKLVHVVLPYSNWSCVSIARSESLLSLRKALNKALFQLGRVPSFHQTDNSSAATHQLADGKRDFNDDYLDLMAHFGLNPRTIAVGQPTQNGDVESLNGHLKRRLNQHLLLRGSRDFDTEQDYQQWLDETVHKANTLIIDKLQEELRLMKPLQVQAAVEFDEIEVKVSKASTLRVKFNTYSVPARLIGKRVRVRLFEERIEVYFNNVLQLRCERLLGRQNHCIDYRHIIWSLIHKPGAFARYRYRESLFPTLTFRKAFDALQKEYGEGRRCDLEYIRLLHLAASTSEHEVELALELLLEEGLMPGLDEVRALVQPANVHLPQLQEPKVELGVYDGLLTKREVA